MQFIQNLIPSFLSIMATSVPCESLFNQTGIIVNELRNRSNSFLLEELTLLFVRKYFFLEILNFFLNLIKKFFLVDGLIVVISKILPTLITSKL